MTHCGHSPDDIITAGRTSWCGRCEEIARMDGLPPDTPFTVYLNDPPTCGVSNRLQRRINAQFAVVAVGLGVVAGVAIWVWGILR